MPVKPTSLDTDTTEDGDAVVDAGDEDDSSRLPDQPIVGLHIELNMQTDDADPPLAGWLEGILCRVASLAGVDRGTLSVAVMDDNEMSRMHQQHKNVDGTTDVLTFDLRNEARGDMEGDLLICLDEATRQAADRDHETRHEVLLYAVHGLLHLIGYDDDTEVRAAQMHRREDELLVAVGLDPVFDRQRDAAATTGEKT